MGLASARGAEQDHLKRRGNENHSGKEGMGFLVFLGWLLIPAVCALGLSSSYSEVDVPCCLGLQDQELCWQ